MKYSKVFLESIGYELPPIVVTSTELEDRLSSVYAKLHISKRQLEALTGIVERRWWEQDYSLSTGASLAAKKAIEQTNVTCRDIDVLIYSGVCRENFEPATACSVANDLGLEGDIAIYDISNACLGILNGIIDIANRIELSQIKAGIVVACESARDINETMIKKMCENPSMNMFKDSIATLTGGSGAVAVLLTDGSFSPERERRLLGGVNVAQPKFHDLCRWHSDAGQTSQSAQTMRTDSVSVLKNGVALAAKTWDYFLEHMGWKKEDLDSIICHQVGSGHQDAILKALQIPSQKDFTTYDYLGNMGTVSLPITAAIAEERDHLLPGNFVGLLGIGSGLNCLMLGCKW